MKTTFYMCFYSYIYDMAPFFVSNLLFSRLGGPLSLRTDTSFRAIFFIMPLSKYFNQYQKSSSNSMDQALLFFKENHGFDPIVLIKVYKFIKEAVNANGFVSENDLHGAFAACDTNGLFSHDSIAAYSSIILNTSMEILFSSSGSVLFKFKAGVYSENDFLDMISRNLRENVKHPEFALVVRDLSGKLDRYRKRSSTAVVERSSTGIKQRGVAIDKLEPIVELMAKLRKLGMDMMFPSKAHDKVLACIFLSAEVLKKPVAHRELIDLVIEVKDCGLFPDFEDVSKTKIRGILALLKHSLILEPYLFEEDPVKLKLSDSIVNFSSLRKLHDSFLISFLSDNNVRFPNSLLKEVIWPQSDEEARLARISDVDAFMRDVKAYFSWQRQVAVTAAVVTARNPEKLVHRDEAVHLGSDKSASASASAAATGGSASAVLGSRVPPLSILTSSGSRVPQMSPGLTSDRTSIEGGSSLNQSPRAFGSPFVDTSPRATTTLWGSSPSSLRGASVSPAMSFGFQSDRSTIGPSRAVVSREEFKQVFGGLGSESDRGVDSSSLRVIENLRSLGHFASSYSLFEGQSHHGQYQYQHQLPPTPTQRIPYVPLRDVNAPMPNAPISPRIGGFGVGGLEFGANEASRRSTTAVRDGQFVPSETDVRSPFSRHVGGPVAAQSIGSNDRLNARVGCIGEGHRLSGSSQPAAEATRTSPWSDPSVANSSDASPSTGGEGASSIWRMRNDDKGQSGRKASFWSLF